MYFTKVNFAVVKKLPVIFICENNLYSVYSPLSVRQPKKSIAKMVKAMGPNIFSCDGNDPLKIFRLLSKASQKKLRKGNGPCFLEFFTYRWLEHCGPNFDNNLNYRSKKEFMYWKKKDPLINLEKR